MRGKAYGCNYFAGEKLLIKLIKCTFYTIPSLDLNVIFIFPILKYRRKTIGSKAFFSIFLYSNFGNFFQKISKISWIYPRKKQFSPKDSQFVFKKSDKNCWKKSLVGRVENLRVVSGYPTSHKES
jgi:hypothetical protein